MKTCAIVLIDLLDIDLSKRASILEDSDLTQASSSLSFQFSHCSRADFFLQRGHQPKSFEESQYVLIRVQKSHR